MVERTPDRMFGRGATCQKPGCTRGVAPGFEWCEQHREQPVTGHYRDREAADGLPLDEVQRRLRRLADMRTLAPLDLVSQAEYAELARMEAKLLGIGGTAEQD